MLVCSDREILPSADAIDTTRRSARDELHFLALNELLEGLMAEVEALLPGEATCMRAKDLP